MQITKMHDCGNDFCVLEYEFNTDYNDLAKKICNRRTGIGSDGLIVIKPGSKYEVTVYDSNGDISLNIGNALRCATKYLFDLNAIRNNKITLIANEEKIDIEVTKIEPFECMVNMGKPNFKNQMIYATDTYDFWGRVIDINNTKITIYSFFLANVQTVIFVDRLNDDIVKFAEEIHSYKLFRRNTNVNFVVVKNKFELDIKTYERNHGFTLASGSGACAAAYAAYKLGKINNKVKCNFEIGSLVVEFGKKDEIFLRGSAHKIFKCDIEEEKLC